LKLEECPSGGNGIEPSSGPSSGPSSVCVDDSDETELLRECGGDEIEDLSLADIIDVNRLVNELVNWEGG
jgi:hypothetical protein